MPTVSRQELAQALAGFRLLNKKKGHRTGPLDIVVSLGQHMLRLSAVRDSHTLIHRCAVSASAAPAPEPFAVPMPVLEEAAKAADKGSLIDLEPEVLHYQVKGVAIASAFPKPAGETQAPSNERAAQALPLKTEVMEAVLEACACASTLESRQVLNGVHLGRDRLAATDGRRLYTRSIDPLPLPEEGIILPLHPVMKLFAGVGDSTCLRLGPPPPKETLSRSFEMVAGPWTWSALLVSGPYPNYRQVIPRETEERQRVEIAQEDALRLLEVLPKLPGLKAKDAPIRLELKEGKAALVSGSNGSASAIVLEESRVSGSGKPEVVTFNREFLLEALRQGFRVLAVKDGLSCVVMEDGERSRLHLWMPLRTEPYQAPRPAEGEDRASAGAGEKPAADTPENVNHETNRLMSKTTHATGPAPVEAEAANRGCPDGESNGNGSHGHDSETDPVTRAVEGLGRLRDLLRDINGAVQEVNVALREAGREHKALEREHRSLRRNLRGLKTLDV